MNIGNQTDLTILEALGDAGTGALETAAIDVSAYEEVMFAIVLGTIGTGTITGLKVQGSNTSGGTYQDITGAAFANVAVDDDDTVKTGVLIVKRLPLDTSDNPVKFLKIVGTVVTQAVPLTVLAIRGHFRDSTDTAASTPEFNL